MYVWFLKQEVEQNQEQEAYSRAGAEPVFLQVHPVLTVWLGAKIIGLVFGKDHSLAHNTCLWCSKHRDAPTLHWKYCFFYCRTQGSAYKCWIKQILGQFMILAVLQLECREDLTAHIPLHPRDIKKYLWNFVKDFLTIRYLFTTLRSIHLEGIATQFQF